MDYYLLALLDSDISELTFISTVTREAFSAPDNTTKEPISLWPK